MPCHGSCRIIKNTDCLLGLIVNSIYNACNSAGKKRRIANKTKAVAVWLVVIKALRHCNICAHTQTCIAHIQRLCVTQCITADIAAICCLFAFHCLFYGIKRTAVRTTSTQNRRAHRKLWFCCCEIFSSRIF